MYRQWGGDIINMSVIPEAKLAREAELEYVNKFSPCPLSPSSDPTSARSSQLHPHLHFY